jgi:hypothetical protein
MCDREKSRARLRSPVLAVRVLSAEVGSVETFGTLTYLPANCLIELRGPVTFSEIAGIRVVVEGREYAAFERDVIENSEEIR